MIKEEDVLNYFKLKELLNKKAQEKVSSSKIYEVSLLTTDDELSVRIEYASEDDNTMLGRDVEVLSLKDFVK